jgi:hypothetical protein
LWALPPEIIAADGEMVDAVDAVRAASFLS